MALAILELLAFDNGNIRFKIDTGSNRYYQLRFGKAVQPRFGLDWVDDVTYATPMALNEAGGELFNSSKEISLPAARLDRGHVYAQLFSFKDTQGKSPAFSPVLKVPVGSGYRVPDFAPSFSLSTFTTMNTCRQFNPPRYISCQTGREALSRSASFDDLLAGIVKIAGPAVMNLLGGQNGGSPGILPGLASGASGGQLDVLTNLLKTILGSVMPVAGGISQGQSLVSRANRHNRFASMQSATYARPFVFGIDDALLASMAGPMLQVLPQLMNAANQKRIQLKQADNKLMGDIISEINRDLLLEQLLDAQRTSDGQPGTTTDINQLMQLLKAAIPATAATGAPSPAPTVSPTPATTPRVPAPPAATNAPATTQSLTAEVDDGSVLSSKAVVSFEMGAQVSWNGAPRNLFVRNQPLQLRLQLKVAEPAPKSLLPKAIVKIVFQNLADTSVRVEKIFKQKDVPANQTLTFAFQADELVQLPANKPISVLAEVRWLRKSGRQYKALGSTEIVLVNQYFLKAQGKEVSGEQELIDMKQFRPFWNKVWESPVLDAVSTANGNKKYMWELNVNAKYSVLLSADHEANGLMETKILRGKPDEESLTETIDGRMKAGIELSIAELNKLLPLWSGNVALDHEKLEALQTADFARTNSGEFIYNLKLKGQAAARGMVWVIPVFKLFECTLSAVSKTDDGGQVVSMNDEVVRFPLPVFARVIGLKSQ